MHLSLTYAYAALLCFLSPRLSKISNLSLGVLSFILVLFVFSSFSKKAKTDIHQSFKVGLPNFKILDVITSPFPTSFTCWHFLVVGTSDNTYVSFTGTYAPTENLLSSCSSGVRKNGIEPRKTDITISKKIRLNGFVSNSFEEIKAAYTATCKSKSWFSFARAPFISGDSLYDLRYSFRSKKSFSTYKIDKNDSDCLRFGAPWTPPRIDLLESL